MWVWVGVGGWVCVWVCERIRLWTSIRCVWVGGCGCGWVWVWAGGWVWVCVWVCVCV